MRRGKKKRMRGRRAVGDDDATENVVRRRAMMGMGRRRAGEAAEKHGGYEKGWGRGGENPESIKRNGQATCRRVGRGA